MVFYTLIYLLYLFDFFMKEIMPCQLRSQEMQLASSCICKVRMKEEDENQNINKKLWRNVKYGNLIKFNVVGCLLLLTRAHMYEIRVAPQNGNKTRLNGLNRQTK